MRRFQRRVNFSPYIEAQPPYPVERIPLSMEEDDEEYIVYIMAGARTSAKLKVRYEADIGSRPTPLRSLSSDILLMSMGQPKQLLQRVSGDGGLYYVIYVIY